MVKWKKSRDPVPDKKEAQKFKDFIKAKYVEKRFAEQSEASDSSDSEDRKAPKTKKKSRKDRKKKKDSSSEDDEPLEAPVKIA
jgi:hypothetical protein